MNLDLAKAGRQSIAVILCLFLVFSGVGPFVEFSPTEPVKASHGGYIYTGGSDGTLKKLTDDGSTVAWEHNNLNIYYSVQVSNGYVYASGTSSVVKIDASDGSQVWNYTSFTMDVRSITIGPDGYVYAGSDSGDVHRITPSGTQDWTFAASSFVQGTAYSSGFAFAGDGNGNVYKLDASTGSQQWVYKKPTSAVRGLGADSDGYSYATGDGQTVHKIHPDGTNTWNYTGSNAQTVSLSLGPNEDVYIGNKNFEVQKIDSSTGSNVWTYTGLSTTVRSVSIDSHGGVYAGEDGSPYEVHKLNSSDGTQIWTYGGHTNSVKGIGTETSYTSAVSGTVSDDSGTQIEGADVSISDQSDGSIVFQGTTDASGSWSTDLGDGDYRVSASKSGYTDNATNFTVSGSAVTVDLQLEEKKDISGYVLDDTGDGVSDANVDILEGGSIVAQTTSSGSGAYTVGGLTSGTYTVRANKSRYANGTTTVDLGSSSATGVNVTLSQSALKGTVKTTDGAPVANATVEIWMYDDANTTVEGVTNPTNEQIVERQVEKFEQLADPVGSISFPENVDMAEEYEGSEATVALIHTKSAWYQEAGDMGYEPPEGYGKTGTGDLSSPLRQLEPEKEYVLSVWDPTKGDGFAEDDIDGKLPGATDGGNVTIERISPSNQTVNSHTVTTEEEFKTGYIVSRKTHEAEYISFKTGFYHITPENGTTQLYKVGEPEREAAESIRDDVKTEQGQLTDRAQEVQDKVQNKTFQRVTVQTDENGRYVYHVPKGYSTVSITAFKGGELLSGYSEPTLGDLKTEVMQQDYNGSIYLSQEPKIEHPPKSGVDVRVREIDSPTYMDIADYLDRLSFIEDVIGNESYQDLQTLFKEPSSDWYREQLLERNEKLNDVIQENEDLSDKYQEISDQSPTVVREVIESGDANTEELREMLNNQSQTLSELRSTVGSQREVIQELRNNSTESGTEHLLNLKIPFNGEPTEEGTLVLVHTSNGTEEMPEEYWSIETIATEDPTGSVRHDYVVIEDYPLGDAAVSNVEVITATEEGKGQREVRVENPAFSGDLPKVDSFNLNTLRPSTDQWVTLSVNPEDEGNYQQLANATVYAPSGAELNSTLSGDELEFKTTDAGQYLIKLDLQSTSGDTITESFRIKAVKPGDRVKMPASVRVQKGLTGRYTLAGDGIKSSSIQRDGSATKVGVVLPEEGGTREVHVYPTGALQETEGTVNVRVMRGSEKGTGAQVEVVLHTEQLQEDATLYRNGAPITTGEGTSAGKRENNPGTSVITTYTDRDGSVSLEWNNDPGRWERFMWNVRTFDASSLNPLTILPAGSVPAPAQLPELPLPQLHISLEIPLQLGAPEMGQIGVPGAAHIDETPGVRL